MTKVYTSIFVRCKFKLLDSKQLPIIWMIFNVDNEDKRVNLVFLKTSESLNRHVTKQNVILALYAAEHSFFSMNCFSKAAFKDLAATVQAFI